MSIIFDLDGTLVDSKAGILQSLSDSFEELGVIPTQSLTGHLIGPPLKTLISCLCDDPKLIDLLAKTFILQYDSHGFRYSYPFPGIDSLLRYLVDTKVDIYLATNKRYKPTEAILKHLGWTNLFCDIISPDIFDSTFPDKSSMLKYIVSNQNLNHSSTIYIGDRYDDCLAAKLVGIPCALVAWGFNDTPLTKTSKEYKVIDSFEIDLFCEQLNEFI
mgnify:CR=1 FL=1